MHILLRFAKGETLANCFSWFSVFYIANSDGCTFYPALRRGKLSRFLSMVFCFLHSQMRRVHLLIRFAKGETLAIFFSWFSVFYTANSDGCTFYSALRRGKLSRFFFFWGGSVFHSQKRRVRLELRSEKGEALAIFVFQGFPFPKPKPTGATFTPL